jgi:hypothetical protein
LPNNYTEFSDLTGKEEAMKPELEVSTVEAEYYFATREVGLKWLSYEDLKELGELRRSTTVIGHLPMRLVILLAADTAEVRLAAQKRSSMYFFESGEVGTRC